MVVVGVVAALGPTVVPEDKSVRVRDRSDECNYMVSKYRKLLSHVYLSDFQCDVTSIAQYLCGRFVAYS